MVDLKHDSNIHYEYWNSLKTIFDYIRASKLTSDFEEDEFQNSNLVKGGNNLEPEIDQELDEMIEGKDIKELSELENEINTQDFSTEKEYWHACLTKIRQAKAKLTIDKLYKEFYDKNKEEIDKVLNQKDDKEEVKNSEIQEDISGMIDVTIAKEMGIQEDELQTLKHNPSSNATANSPQKQNSSEVKSIPKSLRFDLNDTFSFDNFDNESIQLFKDEQKKGFAEDESKFDQDVIFFNNKYEWSHKYRPRKPRFFNRVITGYEWNAYNRQHYDTDNPPPTIVQGYKFNIFYPDLINKNETPQYYLQNCENPDKLRILFKAGAPYEDIAFEIVNKEWDINERNGFKSVFDRGILHLYFNFKKHRYTT